jgi:hypothetical protein
MVQKMGDPHAMAKPYEKKTLKELLDMLFE